ncbi:hypothetical protein H5410_048709 [Solanum commersonii]|uniref:Uncharacterized protein n=1 Tax=Solanum commersonii TaxID=4109 RepID=A0A9J5XIZ2_SOLCO|nr:hypothetical protein H5410_048709 [Solanum commersonii]
MMQLKKDDVALSTLCKLLSCGEARVKVFSRSPLMMAASEFVGGLRKMTSKCNYTGEYYFCNGKQSF